MTDQAVILPKWWGDHFGKRTVWSLIYFLNYSLLSYLAQSQILVISLYVVLYTFKYTKLSGRALAGGVLTTNFWTNFLINQILQICVNPRMKVNKWHHLPKLVNNVAGFVESFTFQDLLTNVVATISHNLMINWWLLC